MKLTDLLKFIKNIPAEECKGCKDEFKIMVEDGKMIKLEEYKNRHKSNYACIRELLDKFPEFIKSAEYDEENVELPYVVIADFKRFFVNIFKESTNAIGEEKKEKEEVSLRIRDFLEKYSSSGDNEIRNLIGAGFLETLDNFVDGDEYEEIQKYFGKETSRIFKEVE